MKSFRELYRESTQKGIVLAFGRFNPPTVGHLRLIEKVAEVAKKNSGYIYRIYASHTTDEKKNPLNYKDKIRLMRKMFSSYGRGIVDSTEKNALEILSSLYSEGFTDVVYVAGSDRVPEFERLLSKYNKVKSTHGFYDFNSITVVSAGERDPDSEDAVAGMSASKMRDAALKNDYAAFSTGLPQGFSDGQVVFKLVRKGLGLKEALSISEEKCRAGYIAGTMFKVGDTVTLRENTSTSFTVTSRKPNYVVLSSGKKHFIKDLLPIT